MALTINTNISSIIAQRNLDAATNILNKSIERMTTGYKINHAADNAAGYSIANLWKTQLGTLDVAADNAATGLDLLTTAEETYGLLTSHLQRVRDLTEQAANGTYGSQSLRAIQSEIYARLQEVDRISANAEFNGIKLLAYTEDGDGSGISSTGIDLQVGLYANEHSQINLKVDLFRDASVSGLFANIDGLSDIITSAGGGQLSEEQGLTSFSAACAGLIVKDGDFALGSGVVAAKDMITFIDQAINDISSRVTEIGAAQNRVESAVSAIDVQYENLTSSLSTLRDADIAEESSTYIQAQILQQAAATLLSTANQTPSIALSLI